MSKKYFEYFIYSLIIIIVYSLISAGKYLHYPPAGIHHWAQSDRASIAYIYYQYNNSFFLPMTFNINNGNGITGVEFPIVYYIVAQFYKIFGFNDFIFRFFNLGLTLVGFYYFIELLKLFNKNIWLIILGIVLLYTSPIFIYYSFSYVPDVTSLNLFIISLYFFEKFRNTNSKKYLIYYFILISISVLIKISFAIYLISLLSSYLLLFNKKKFITTEKIYVLITSVISLLFCFIWYSYSKSINVKYNSGVFLMDFKPSKNINEYVENMTKSIELWGYEFMNPYSIFITIVIIIFILSKIRILNRFYVLLFTFSIIGALSFTYLFSSQFIFHDYYYIQFYSIFIILYIIFINHLNNNISINKSIISPILISISIFSLIILKNNIAKRFDKYSSYNNYSAYHNTINTININQELDSLNIPDSAKFIVYDDPSMNISLYYLKRFGVQLSYLSSKETVDYYLSKNEFDYILINNNSLIKYSFFNNRLGELILNKNNYSIYKKTDEN